MSQNAIDDKKDNNSGFKPDFKAFIKNYLSSIIFTIGIMIFLIGTLGLYTTKVAQSNILPDDIELAPYTLLDRIVKDIDIDINISRESFISDNSNTLSQKAIFQSKEFIDSFNKSFLCYLKGTANPDKGIFSNISLFLISVYENLVSKNFMAINKIFLYLGYLPESIIMLVYGIFGPLLWFGLFGFNFCISIFYHFINIPQLFRTGDENIWESNDSISFFRITKLILFCFIWGPIGFFSAMIVPPLFTLYGLLVPLFVTYKIKDKPKTDGNNELNYNVLDFIKDTFMYKKLFFFILSTISLFSNASRYLGYNGLIGVLIAVVFAYFMGLYSNEMPINGNDGFTDKIRQNIKHATIIDNSAKMEKPKLVEVCNPIRSKNDKIDELKSKGEMRQLTKPINKEVEVGVEMPEVNINQQGGSNYFDVPEYVVSNNSQQQVQSGGRRKRYNIRLI